MKSNKSLEFYSSKKEEVSGGDKLKTSASISELSKAVIDGFVKNLDQEDGEDLGNLAPLKKNKFHAQAKSSLTIETDEGISIQKPKEDFSEADKIYQNKLIAKEEDFFSSPGPRAPIRQSSKGTFSEHFKNQEERLGNSSPMRLSLNFNQGQGASLTESSLDKEITNLSSPSSSPRSKTSRIEDVTILKIENPNALHK